MSEAALWKNLESVMLGRWHASRVESHETSPGFPDVDFCCKGDGHIELKYGTPQKMPIIRPTQVRWLLKRASAGGVVFILTHLVIDEENWYLWHYGALAMILSLNRSAEYWFNNRINEKYWTLDRDETYSILSGER